MNERIIEMICKTNDEQRKLAERIKEMEDTIQPTSQGLTPKELEEIEANQELFELYENN